MIDTTTFLICTIAGMYIAGVVLFLGMTYWAPVIRGHKFMLPGAFFWPVAGFVVFWMGSAKEIRELRESDLPPDS